MSSPQQIVHILCTVNIKTYNSCFFYIVPQKNTRDLIKMEYDYMEITAFTFISFRGTETQRKTTKLTLKENKPSVST